ncbi:hypothetical protein TSUD_199640, partial [Trifolium subterraneum]
GCKSGISNLPVVPVTPAGSSQSSSVLSSAKISSPVSVVQVSLTSSANEIDQHIASEYEDYKLQNCPQVSSHVQSTSNSMHHCAPRLSLEATGFSELLRNPFISSRTSLRCFSPGNDVPPWAFIQNSSRNGINIYDREFHVQGSSDGPEAYFTVAQSNAMLDAVCRTQDGEILRDRPITDVYMHPIITGASQTVNQQVKKEHDLGSFNTPFSDHVDHPVVAPKDVDACKDESEYVEFGEFKKLDSFGQWMDKEIGGDCDNSLMASDSGNFWNTLVADNKDKE